MCVWPDCSELTNEGMRGWTTIRIPSRYGKPGFQ